MHPFLCEILQPPAPPAGAPWARRRCNRIDCDIIPVITERAHTLKVRAATPRDVPLLADLLASLSERSARLRFFRPLNDRAAIRAEAMRVVAGCPPRVALVATASEAGSTRAIALAELVRDSVDPGVAELALLVRDDYQHEGIGRMLLQMLVEVALRQGVETLDAILLPENQASRKLIRGLGLPYAAEMLGGEIRFHITLPRC